MRAERLISYCEQEQADQSEHDYIMYTRNVTNALLAIGQAYF